MNWNSIEVALDIVGNDADGQKGEKNGREWCQLHHPLTKNHP